MTTFNTFLADEEITTEKRFFNEPPLLDEQFQGDPLGRGSSGLSINLEFEQETTARTALNSELFTVSSESPTFEIGTDDVSKPPEQPRSFDASKFFNTNTNVPSRGLSKNKESKTDWKNKFFKKNDEKNELLKDIIDILEEKPDEDDSKGPKVVVNEKRLPFTVVRVSSSVSQIRPNSNENNIRVSGKTPNNEKEEPENDSEANKSTHRTFFFPPRTTPRTVIDVTESDKKKSEKKKSSGSSGGRPPFLKPIAKFPDIRIPSLDKKNNNNVRKPENFRKFDFSRGSGKNRPIPSVLDFRTTTVKDTPLTTTDQPSQQGFFLDNRPKQPEFSGVSDEGSTTTAKVFVNIFNRFSFTTPDDEGVQPTESFKESLIDLIPKENESKETTSSRSLLDLIPGLNLDSNDNSFEQLDDNDQIDNEVGVDNEEVSTLRASLDIIPIKSTTDRNAVDVTEAPKEDDVIEEVVRLPETTRDLQIIPIPPRPPRPTPIPTDATETTADANTATEQTTRRISRLQQIVQSRRTTASPVSKPTKQLSSKLETVRTGIRPTISIRFRNKQNATVPDVTANDIEASGTGQPNDPEPSVQTTKLVVQPTSSIDEDEEVITTEVSTPHSTKSTSKPNIGGRSKSRFRPSKLSELFPKRGPSSNAAGIGSKRRPFFGQRNRGTTTPPSSNNDNNDEDNAITTPESIIPKQTTRRRPLFRKITTRPPVPQNTRSPLLKSILERARQRGVGRRTTRAPIKIVNKVHLINHRI